MHGSLAAIQKKTSVLPGYAFKEESAAGSKAHPAWWGKSLSGLAGGALTLILAGLMWFFLSRQRKPY